jgi:hypothetical protein
MMKENAHVMGEALVHNAGNAATGGIWRVRESGRTQILKVARPPSEEPRGRPAWPTSDEPTHWNYWRRETLAYTTGLAATVYADAGIVAPDLIRVLERSDGSVALWLADATGTPGSRWSVDRLAHFARQLGHAQAEWAERVPDLPGCHGDGWPSTWPAGTCGSPTTSTGITRPRRSGPNRYAGFWPG